MGGLWCTGCFSNKRRPSTSDVESLSSEPGALLPAIQKPAVDYSYHSSSIERKTLGEWLRRAGDSGIEEAYAEDDVQFRSVMALKGVPQSIRWKVWRAVTGCREIFKPGLYEEIRLAVTLNVQWIFEHRNNLDTSQSLSNDVPSVSGRSLRSGEILVDASERDRIEEIVGLVKQDLRRTFPCSAYFSDDSNLARLGNVIVSYAAINKEVGYCQGMNFLAGLLLQVSDSEQETFWMLMLVMVRYNLQALYRPEIPLLHLLKFQFQELLKIQCPKVEKHFEHLFFLPELYAVKWFFSLFAYSLPETLVLSLWDFIFAGCPPQQRHTGVSRAILLLALGIIKVLQKKLLRCHTVCEVIAEFDSSFKNLKSVEPFLKEARRLDRKIPQALFETLRVQWAERNPTGNQAISEGELVALLMPSAILEWEGIKRTNETPKKK